MPRPTRAGNAGGHDRPQNGTGEDDGESSRGPGKTHAGEQKLTCILAMPYPPVHLVKRFVSPLPPHHRPPRNDAVDSRLEYLRNGISLFLLFSHSLQRRRPHDDDAQVYARRCNAGTITPYTRSDFFHRSFAKKTTTTREWTTAVQPRIIPIRMLSAA